MDYFVSPHTLSNIAAAIRYKLGTSELFSVSEFPSKINQIDIDLFDKLNNGTISRYYNNQISYIGPYAFYDCTSLQDVNIPEVSNISGYAFCNCTSLSNISIPKVQYLTQSHAFTNCINLTTISLPNILSFGLYVFSSCTSLRSIYITKQYSSTSLPRIYSNTFYSMSDFTIYVPQNLLSYYLQSYNWSKYYSSRLVGI